MYESTFTKKEFLRTTAILFIKRVSHLKEIDSKVLRGKLPLPLLKEKHESIVKILSALRELAKGVNYDVKEEADFAETLINIGILINQASLDYDQEKYDKVLGRFRQMILEWESFF